MNAKKWIVIWSSIPILLIAFALVLIKMNNLPLRVSNSISYDVKLNFMRSTKIVKKSNTIVVGSSMALNNISGITLEENSRKFKKVANISSWGLQTSEVLQLIELINLDKIDYIIYSTQYLDFETHRLKDIDKVEVIKYLNNQFTTYPYIKTIKTLISNLNNYIRYNSLYMDPNKYRYLNYDRTGSVNFTFASKYISKSRWESNDKAKYNLSEECFKDLIELSELSKKKNIKLIVVTTPIRKSILLNNNVLLKTFNQYINKLKNLSNKNMFKYINCHKLLNLSDSYFVDKEHLNKRGAILVSNEIIKQIN